MTQTMQRPDQADPDAQTRPQRSGGLPGLWLVAVAAALAYAGLLAVGVRTDLTGSSPSTVPEAGTLQVSGTGMTKTLPCHAGYLSVSGARNTITLTGHCTSVSVSGSANHVAVDSTDAASASGNGNVVLYHWGSPKTANVGTANVVRQG
ncbi:DUF3060 domain-containing protein [Mycobacterium arosiense]|uniref:DUF3060 domain-containing protein n=1 Tax=Mycobacterium arosiense ATCC BAA-1401 = DSM 45069 TaxID=1265311 RepID=A0A1W9ZKE6_MYCAI|nr:DUF3060 domain-containing protein [Mycobacterium arosiense]ORA17178.1 hypothetical protein BST14_09240 [Mycobacterium arosiense ATCC BAA-1401 = DSM 45069]